MSVRSYIHKNIYQLMLVVLVIVLPLIAIWLVGFYYESKIGPEQPIAFSHRVHANDKEISCFFCHEGALETGHAGIPPVETCMLCHDRIIIHHPEIEKLHAYYNTKEPVEWVQVEGIPDYTFFNHSLHIFRQVDCSECHGNVRLMDRVETVNEFQMSFCVDCHKEEEASIDCFTCHR